MKYRSLEKQHFSGYLILGYFFVAEPSDKYAFLAKLID